MIKNRYDNILREHNQEIINLSPANQTMRIELALEIKRILEGKPDTEILEIWIWEWDLTKYLLQYNPELKLDCLDISPEMIASAKQNLWEDNVHFIQEDAYEYLDNPETKAYGIIVSAWTIHNFPRKDKIKLFKKIYDKLGDWWVMMIMDKIYTGSHWADVYFLRQQNERYKYLSKEAEEAIIDHERQDFEDEYRMEESQTKEALEEIWFRWIEVLDRIERDVILVARK